jgi:hypothetical protein
MTKSATGTPMRAAVGPGLATATFAPPGEPMPLVIRVKYILDLNFESGLLGS